MDFHVTTPSGSRTVSINLPPLPYGVMVSGGFDSSLLLALVMITRAAEGHLVPFTCFNIRRGGGTERFSRQVVDLMRLHFDRPIQLEHVDLPVGVPHSKSVPTPMVPILDSGRVCQIISGDTTNPPIATPGWQQPQREALEDQFKYKRWQMPMLHIDKSHTVALVRQLGLHFIEHYSHTCTEQDQWRCRQCFQCQERAWGYTSQGLIDPGEQ